MTTETFWAGITRKTAERYIKNVVVVDNEAYIRVPKGPLGEHTLDVRTLAKHFAERNILCSTLAPSKEDFLDPAVADAVKLVLASDVAILDWQLDDRKGKDPSFPCKEIIRIVLERDSQMGNPLRLIVIYTAENPSDDLLVELEKHLSGVSHERLKETFGLQVNNLHIVIHKKQFPSGSRELDPAGAEPATGLSEDKEERVDLTGLMPQGVGVGIEDLPAVIIKHFAELANGILPTVTLNAVSAIRENAGTLTGIFSKDLDPAFVYHTAIIPDSVDGSHFLIEQIKEELGAALEIDADIQQCFEPENLAAWFESTNPDYYSPCDTDTKLTADQFNRFINENSPGKVKIPEDDSRNRINIYQDSAKIKKLSCITSFKRESFSPTRSKRPRYVPVLTQGTVLSCTIKKKNTYWLCLIPKCDSVRIDSSTLGVPLLRLNIDIDKPHMCCNFNEVVSLVIPKKVWKNIEIKKFNVDTQKHRIFAVPQDGNFVFRTSEIDHIWIGDLKDATLLSTLQRIFPHMTRLGVDEFEWLRLNRDGK
ncbi:MAG: response regulator receiver domain [Desulfovibrionaceae bacterium]